MSSAIYSLTARPTIESTRDLIPQLPQAPTDTDDDSPLTLRTRAQWLQTITEFVNKLRPKIDTLQATHDAWLNHLQNLSEAKRAQETPLYEEMVAQPEGLIRTINEARDVLATAQAMQTTAQDAVTQLPHPRVAQGVQLQQHNATVKLPKLTLHEFDGDIVQWPRFWSAFRRSVGDQQLDPADKLTYLLRSLKGEAKQIVAGYTVRSENYEPVVRLLKNAFDQPKMIKAQLRKKLRDIQPVKRNTDLGTTIIAIEQVLQQLEALNENINESFFEDLIEEKLPFWLVDEIYRRKEESVDWNTERLREYLRTTALRRQQAAKTTGNGSATLPSVRHNQAQQARGQDFVRPQHQQRQGSHQEGGVSSAFVCANGSNQPATANSRPTNNRWRGSVRGNRAAGFRPPVRNNRSAGNVEMPANRGAARPPSNCAFCGNEHFHKDCTVYATFNQRLERARSLGLCEVCLHVGHFKRDCKTRLWPCLNCQGRHVTAMCPAPARSRNTHARANRRTNAHVAIDEGESERTNTHAAIDEEDVEEIAALTVAPTHTDENRDKSVLLMCKEVVVQNPEKPHLSESVMVFFDTGSHRSYITSGLAAKLELSTRSESSLSIGTFAKQAPRRISTRNVDAEVRLADGGVTSMQLSTMDYLTQHLQAAEIRKNEVRDIGKQQLLSTSHSWQQPQILVGMDYFMQFIRSFRTTKSGFYVINTTIGPILAGCGQMQNNILRNEVTAQYTALDVDTFWDLENLGIKDVDAPEDDEVAYDMFKSTVQREESGRYVVSWPWKSETPQLSNNYGMCMGRLRSVLDRLQQHPQLLEQYNNVFREQANLGMIEEASGINRSLTNFLPHQPVLTPRKATTKLRVVFDASAKTRSGSSLNEELFRGPVILPHLGGILLRFRTYKFVVIADVEKAFLQIGLHEKDRNVTCFLWVKDVNKPPEGNNLVIYRYCRVLFGVISSPFLLAAVIKHHLQGCSSTMSKALLENLYVDNVLVGTESESEAEDVYETSKKLFADAHMNLREFLSNSAKVSAKIPDDDRSGERKVSVLGLQWDIDQDNIVMKFHNWTEDAITKRTTLSFIASHFDPLGFLAPAMLLWKLLCQELWHKKYDWDIELFGKERKAWKKLKDGWTPGTLSVPRLAFSPKGLLQFHVFCDASNSAYAAAVYARYSASDSTKSALIFAKSHLMSKKKKEKLTIPKAELMGAVIGVRAIRFVKTQLQREDVQVVAWSDSKCAIAWIKTENLDKLSRFVKNRVKEIQEAQITYRYVPTQDNPADLATRGVSSAALDIGSSKNCVIVPETNREKTDADRTGKGKRERHSRCYEDS